MTFPINFKIVLCQEACQEVPCCVLLVSSMWTALTHTLKKKGKKTVNFFGGQKLEVCYHASYLFINRACRFVGFSWKLPLMFLRYYCTEVHKAWMKFEIFLSQFIWVWHQGKSNLTIYFLRNQWEYWNCLTLFVIAHYLLSDTVQFVSRSGVTCQEAGNSIKQTPSMLHLNAYICLPK